MANLIPQFFRAAEAAGLNPMTSTATQIDKPISEAYYALAEYGLSLGVENLAAIDGCWEHQIDERWWVAANGHREDQQCSHGVAVPPFHWYIEFNGWPAGVIGPFQGVIAAGEAANEDAFLAALKAARSNDDSG